MTTSSAATTSSSPRKKRAAPTPPASATIGLESRGGRLIGGVVPAPKKTPQRWNRASRLRMPRALVLECPELGLQLGQTQGDFTELGPSGKLRRAGSRHFREQGFERLLVASDLPLECSDARIEIGGVGAGFDGGESGLLGILVALARHFRGR